MYLKWYSLFPQALQAQQGRGRQGVTPHDAGSGPLPDIQQPSPPFYSSSLATSFTSACRNNPLSRDPDCFCLRNIQESESPTPAACCHPAGRSPTWLKILHQHPNCETRELVRLVVLARVGASTNPRLVSVNVVRALGHSVSFGRRLVL